MRTKKEFEREIRGRENLLKNILVHKRDYEFLSKPSEARTNSILFTKTPVYKS